MAREKKTVPLAEANIGQDRFQGISDEEMRQELERRRKERLCKEGRELKARQALIVEHIDLFLQFVSTSEDREKLEEVKRREGIWGDALDLRVEVFERKELEDYLP